MENPIIGGLVGGMLTTFGAILKVALPIVLPLLVLAVVLRLYAPRIKGKVGEWAVASALSAYKEEHGYHLRKGLLLPDGGVFPDGAESTTEVDLVLFSPYGIFVMEVKNYGGWIYGNNERSWTQTFRTGRRTIRNSFQNPLRQNYKHVKVLQTITGLPKDCFHSVVVFVGDAVFQTPMPDNVLHKRELHEFIAEHPREILTEQQIQDAIITVYNNDKSKAPGAMKNHRKYTGKKHR